MPTGDVPVVLTAVRALAAPETNLRGVNATTHLVAPLCAGARRDRTHRRVRVRHRRVRTGQPPNATVGRAVRLVLLHVAGARPGSGDAATHGQPAKYTFCAAENLDASPWGATRPAGASTPRAQ